MKVLSISWYKVPTSIRRFLGILIVLMGGYLAALFCIKFIFYVLYVGTVWIDKFFRFLVRWWNWKQIEELQQEF